MIIEENKLIEGRYVSGYYLTIHDLAKLVRDYLVESHDDFMCDDETYIQEWLKKHCRIVKND